MNLKKRSRSKLPFAVILGLAAAILAPSGAGAQLDLAPLEKMLAPPPASPAPPTAAPAPAPAPGSKNAKAANAVPAPVPVPVSTCGPVPVPPKLRRSPARNTSGLVEKVQPLVDRGVPLGQALVLAAPPFPVAGKANYSDDWKNPRTTPCPHLHQGTDIFADFGTPIVSSGPGTLVSKGNHGAGGNALWVVGDDRNTFYYAHLQSFAPGLEVGQHFEKGTLLGEVGDSGNAEGGAPHLHFQFHPPIKNRKGAVVSSGAMSGGGSRTPPVNPKGFLDVLLTQAEEQAPALVAQLLAAPNSIPEVTLSQGLLGQPELAIRYGLDVPENPVYQLSPATQEAANAARGLGLVALITLFAAIVLIGRLWWQRAMQSRAEATDGSPYVPSRPRHQLI